MDYVLTGPQLRISYSNGTIQTLGPCSGQPAVADMNNDGVTDIIANCGTLKLYVGPEWEERTLQGMQKPYGLQIADIDRNGRLDMVAANDGSILSYIQK